MPPPHLCWPAVTRTEAAGGWTGASRATVEGHAGRGGVWTDGGGICAGTRAAPRPGFSHTGFSRTGSPRRGRIQGSAALLTADGHRDEAQVGGVVSSRDSGAGRARPPPADWL